MIYSSLMRGPYLIPLPELKSKVYEVLYPNKAVFILVTNVEDFFQLFQKPQQLLLIREDIAVHCRV